MKFVLVLSLVSLASFAKINMKIDLSTTVAKDKKEQIKKRAIELNTELDSVQTIKLDNKNEIIEIKVSKKFPEDFKALEGFDEKNYEFYIESKIYDTSKGEKKLISAPKVITVPGKEAIIEKHETKDDAEITTRMIIKSQEI